MNHNLALLPQHQRDEIERTKRAFFRAGTMLDTLSHASIKNELNKMSDSADKNVLRDALNKLHVRRRDDNKRAQEIRNG